MANGDPIFFNTWDTQSTLWDEWYPYDTSGGTASYDTGQSVPDGSSTCMKIAKTISGSPCRIESGVDGDTFDSFNTGCVSFWFKGTTTNSDSTGDSIMYVYLLANSGRNWLLRFNASGDLQLYFWGANKVSSTITTIDSGWHYIQVAWDFSTVTNKLTLSVDGTVYPEETYAAAASPALDVVQIGPGTGSVTSTSTQYYGPIIFTQGYHIPSRMRVALIRPNGDTNSNWTVVGGAGSRWASLTNVPPNTATYVESATSAQEQQMTLGDVSPPAGYSVKAVSTWVTQIAGVGSAPWAYVYLVDGSGNAQYMDQAGYSSPQYSTSIPVVLAPDGGAWTSAKINGCSIRLTHVASSDTARIAEAGVRVLLVGPYQKALTASLSFTGNRIVSKMKKRLTAALSYTSAQTRRTLAKYTKVFTAALSFLGSRTSRPKRVQSFNATVTFTTNAVQFMWRQLQDPGGWFVKKGRLRRRKPY